MRELTVRIRFTSPSLGNVKARDGSGVFYLPRSKTGQVLFLGTWFQTGVNFAAKVMNRYQAEVRKIHWDIALDAVVRPKPFTRRYYKKGKRQRYVLHESLLVDQVIGINCVVPTEISDDDFWSLMRIVGQYHGLSPWVETGYGLFVVESLRPRRPSVEQTHENTEAERRGPQELVAPVAPTSSKD